MTRKPSALANRYRGATRHQAEVNFWKMSTSTTSMIWAIADDYLKQRQEEVVRYENMIRESQRHSIDWCWQVAEGSKLAFERESG